VGRPARLVLLRHGESVWNHEQRFTGWADVGLTAGGQAQMRAAAAALHAAGVALEVAFSSTLRRCTESQQILLEALATPGLEQHFDWRLNERHYGGLTGRSKPEAEREFGAAEVLRWRRGYDAVPPPLDEVSARHLGALQTDGMPLSESLEQTVARVTQVWVERLLPALRAGRTAAVVGHGNSLRALVKVIENLEPEAVVGLEINNAEPWIYGFDDTATQTVSRQILAGSMATRSQIL
jgi:2,3-bisphosphoglycerate-dependent phosphoglycerate mutase